MDFFNSLGGGKMRERKVFSFLDRGKKGEERYPVHAPNHRIERKSQRQLIEKKRGGPIPDRERKRNPSIIQANSVAKERGGKEHIPYRERRGQGEGKFGTQPSILWQNVPRPQKTNNQPAWRSNRLRKGKKKKPST